MGKTSKTFALILTLIIALSALTVLMVKSSNAQSIPTPSTPEFTLKLADHSYDVPAKTTSTTDPYTGKTTTTTEPGYHVQNQTIDVIFKNQPYPATINGNSTAFYYDIAIKPHFTESWYGPYDKGWFPAETNSQYTTVSFPRSDYPEEGQIDVRAQVYLGYHYSYVDYSHIQPVPESSFASSASDWSEAQTLTLGKISTVDSPTPTAPVVSPSTMPSLTQPSQTFTPMPTASDNIPLTSMFDNQGLTIVTLIAVALAFTSVTSIIVYRKWSKRGTHE